MDETASDTADEKLVVDLELNGVLELLLLGDQHLVELLSLRDGPRESIENESTSCQSCRIWDTENPTRFDILDCSPTRS